jgi:hypothetical protein
LLLAEPWKSLEKDSKVTHVPVFLSKVLSKVARLYWVSLRLGYFLFSDSIIAIVDVS